MPEHQRRVVFARVDVAGPVREVAARGAADGRPEARRVARFVADHGVEGAVVAEGEVRLAAAAAVDGPARGVDGAPRASVGGGEELDVDGEAVEEVLVLAVEVADHVRGAPLDARAPREKARLIEGFEGRPRPVGAALGHGDALRFEREGVGAEARHVEKEPLSEHEEARLAQVSLCGEALFEAPRLLVAR